MVYKSSHTSCGSKIKTVLITRVANVTKGASRLVFILFTFLGFCVFYFSWILWFLLFLDFVVFTFLGFLVLVSRFLRLFTV